ncbi:MAG: hypothetical protein DRR16_12550 [Candidatus Parabeggiatoa sp. nov. 3]|nr:MAG: hypothetical protein DRR00_18870 [Gammaproteobacteria bacterium]RKZ52251.1 MAG: hypothetical protein DRQ99_32595 [Gammaproteobacteria bacterium]RKZ85235.1 MAG: hypothetical protein DRR16_12550 [Gammaproteobacteria bacterium]HEW98409.1 hypothetical protein [Beggiatoa sp.]
MNKPQLVAETPRAGKWNHRFIAAPNGSLSDSEVAKMIAAARRNPQGDDYLAVSAETTQSMSGRTGKEILVLTGVDVKKLSDNQRQQIIAQLGQQLIDLATLVTEKIDWDKEGQAILVKRPELGEWEKGFVGLPIFTPQQKAAVPKKPISNLVKMVGGVVGILLVLGLGIWKTIDEKGSPSTSQSPSLNKDSDSAHVDVKNNQTAVAETASNKGPSRTKESSKENKDQNKLKLKCVESLKKGIVSFLKDKGDYSTECQKTMPAIPSETTFKAFNNFLKEWCNVELTEEHNKNDKDNVPDQYGLSTFQFQDLLVTKEEFDSSVFKTLKDCLSNSSTSSQK